MLSDAPRFVATDMNTVSSNATTVVLYLVVGLCRQFVRWPCFKGGGRGKRVKAGRAIEPLPALLFVCTGRCHKSRGNARRRMLRTSPPGGLTPWRAGAALGTASRRSRTIEHENCLFARLTAHPRKPQEKRPASIARYRS